MKRQYTNILFLLMVFGAMVLFAARPAFGVEQQEEDIWLDDKLEGEGTLIVRATVPSGRNVPWKRWMETLRLSLTRTPERFRTQKEITEFMTGAGFKVDVFPSARAGVEEKWFVGKKMIS